jgi:hypothetical protein
MLEWMPSSSGAACNPHRLGDGRAPVAALRHKPGVAQALHQHDQQQRFWLGDQGARQAHALQLTAGQGARLPGQQDRI